MQNSDVSIKNIITTEGLSKSFKGLRAVDDYRLFLKKGEILGVIGPNGAGKSTIFNLLTGHIHPTSGVIRFVDHDITSMEPEKIARLGIGRTFQNIRLFSSMSVLDNVITAHQILDSGDLATTLFSLPSFFRRERRLEEESRRLLALFNLETRALDKATSLPYGDQGKLEIVRALALRPKLLLLDEPVAGMTPQESMGVLGLIRRIRDEFDLTIIIVEHNMPVVMQLCERIQVLSYGRIIAEGTPDEIRTNPLVIEAYLGKVQTDAQSR